MCAIGSVRAKQMLHKQHLQRMMCLFVANRVQDATDEYEIAGATDREKMLLEYKARIDKMTPVSVRERMLGALWGAVAGDALGMVTDGSVSACRCVPLVHHARIVCQRACIVCSARSRQDEC